LINKIYKDSVAMIKEKLVKYRLLSNPNLSKELKDKLDEII
jgi:hypothetical protein